MREPGNWVLVAIYEIGSTSNQVNWERARIRLIGLLGADEADVV